MSLSPGTRLGPYEVTALLGEGGMGKVWRARHLALKRDDALKVLPDAFATDPDRLARFQREAQVLASLNHPNIAHVYGLEQSDGVQALVMELVEGPTLADRIAQGPIPVDEALAIAKQIAEALEAAHERGIIHRDLKPANIKLRPDGTVKVLDFGLAKLADGSAPTAATPLLTNSPTINSPAATVMGVLLGTAPYMAPEQARGKPADKRADVWAFGCVLYEMLTGRCAFDGGDVSETLAFVLTKEPEWSRLPSITPAPVRRLLRRTLEKDRNRRIADLVTARIEIDDAVAIPVGGRSQEEPRRLRPTWRRVGAFALAAAVGGVLTGTITRLSISPTLQPVTRLTVATPTEAPLYVNGFDRDVAIAPDGTRIAYVGGSSSQPWIFIRALDQLEPIPLVQAGAPRGLFFSPDGQWVGFVDLTDMKKVAVTGGPAVTIPGVVTLGAPRGATWLPDETIVFAVQSGTLGLQQISSNGGSARVLTRPNRERGEVNHIWPESLPDGRSVLFTISTTGVGTANSQVAVLDLRTGEQKILVQGGSSAHYVSSGHLVYAAAGALRAAAFDLDRLEVVGAAIPVVSQVLTTSIGAVDFDVARNGTLLYVPGSVQALGRTLAWVDRQGHEQPLKAPARAYTYPRISPDGTRVALDIRDQDNDLWIWDLTRETLTRLTSDPTFDRWPVWMPDGRRILFSSDRAGTPSLFWQIADGSGTAEPLGQRSGPEFVLGITPDGTRVLLQDQEHQDLFTVTLDKEHRVQPLMQTRFSERNGEISPDGRWLAYDANDTGQFEIYVRPFPDVNSGHWQVSTGGGARPLWSRSGQELFYLSPTGALMSVRIDARGTWAAGAPMKLFEGAYLHGAINYGRTYDVAGDGQRFLMIKEPEVTDAGTVRPNLVIVQNWHEELKRLVPTR